VYYTRTRYFQSKVYYFEIRVDIVLFRNRSTRLFCGKSVVHNIHTRTKLQKETKTKTRHGGTGWGDRCNASRFSTRTDATRYCSPLVPDSLSFNYRGHPRSARTKFRAPRTVYRLECVSVGVSRRSYTWRLRYTANTCTTVWWSSTRMISVCILVFWFF